VDIIHVNTGGLVRLGRRLARQALAIAYGRGDISTGPRVVRMERVACNFSDHGAVRVVCDGVTGAWQPADNIAGFGVYDAAGQPIIKDHLVYNAMPEKGCPRNILLQMNLPLPPGGKIGYGRGLMPYCNAVDSADMPLCGLTITASD